MDTIPAHFQEQDLHLIRMSCLVHYHRIYYICIIQEFKAMLILIFRDAVKCTFAECVVPVRLNKLKASIDALFSKSYIRILKINFYR